MPVGPVITYHSPRQSPPPESLVAFVSQQGYRLTTVTSAEEVLALVNRTHPALIVLDGAGGLDGALGLCRALKGDPFTAIVPVLIWDDAASLPVTGRVFEAGADECFSQTMTEEEKTLRIRMMILRADRDVSVHPTTRLPGTVQIERDIASRLASGELFGVCYADIDHFKEFNDRYSYNHGDRVILLLSRILRDVVKTHAPTGFIGHIGGDDFIFNVPIDRYDVCCREIIGIFDTLAPFQYSPEDHKAGFFWGRDRQGQLHRIPLMSLSIGVVTNVHRSFTHTAQISELATEMKAYAKSKEGSLYVVDRRRSDRGLSFEPAGHPAQPEEQES